MATYQIRAGDTLSKIAQQFGYGGDYMSIARANNIANPNLIRAGATLNIPDRLAPGAAPASAPAPVQQPQQQVQPQSTGVTPEGIAISSLPPDLVWNEQLDVSNPVKQAKYQQLVGQRPQQNQSASVSSAIPNIAQPQAPNFQAIYDKTIQEATNTFAPQITEAQAGVDLVNKQIADRTAALNVALGKINDNPYYSEATRVGRARKLQEAYNNDVSLFNSQLGIASNKLTNTQNMAEKAKADAQVKINIASNQYNIENQQYRDQLQQINSYLSAGMFNNASGADIAQISTSTGMSTSMVQSIIDASKKKNEVKPELKSVSDDTGQYLVAVQTTSEGLKILNREKIGEAPKKEKAGTGTDDKDEKAFYAAINDAQEKLRKGVSWGEVWNLIHLQFPQINPAVIDQLLDKNTWASQGAYQNYQQGINQAKKSTPTLNLGGS